MNTLACIETHRTIAVVDEALDQLQLLGLITPKVVSALPQIAEVSPKAAEVIDAYSQLCQLYETFFGHRTLSKTKFRSSHGEYKKVAKELRECARELVALLQLDRQVVKLLSSFSEEPNPGHVHFRKTLRELRDLVMTKMNTSVEDEAFNEERLLFMTDQEAKLAGDVRSRRETLQRVTEEQATVLAERAAVVASLESEFQNLEMAAASEAAEIRERDEELLASYERSFSEQEPQLADEIMRLETKCADLKRTHREAEEKARKDKNRKEQVALKWVSRYDTDMGEKQNILDALKETLDSNTRELEFLVSKFDHIDAEAARKEEERLAVIRAEEEKQYLHGVITVQRLWRGKQCRRQHSAEVKLIKKKRIELKKARKARRKAKRR